MSLEMNTNPTVVIFSGTSILRYELGVMGRASTDSLRVVWSLHAQCGQCGHRWQKVARNTEI